MLLKCTKAQAMHLYFIINFVKCEKNNLSPPSLLNEENTEEIKRILKAHIS